MNQFYKIISLIRSELKTGDILSRKESVQEQIFRKIAQRKKKRLYIRYLSAASFLLVLMVGLKIFNMAPFHKVNWEMIATTNGVRDTVCLADGSRIILNGGSSLEIPDNFGKKNREIHFYGEAYFEIAKNPDKPFIVHSDGMDVKVLGTSFNVKAYPSDSVFETILTEGHVCLINQRTDEMMNMLPNDKVVFNKQDERFLKIQVNALNEIGWIVQKYEFEAELFSEISKKLERGFGVTFIVENQDVLTKKISAEFKSGESFEDIMQILSLSNSFEYTINQKTIIIK